MVKVAQCWDDGVATDIRLTEIFRKYNAKATFNLCPGLMPDDKTAAAGWTPIEGRNWSVNGFSGGTTAYSYRRSANSFRGVKEIPLSCVDKGCFYLSIYEEWIT